MLTVTPAEAVYGEIVHDPIHTVLNVIQQVIGQVKQELQHAEDLVKYSTMISNQVQQIKQLTTLINSGVEELRRVGDPNTYLNMLGLNELMAEIHKLEDGVGSTVGEFQRTADGIAALKSNATGLYEDLTNLPDRFGNKIKYETNRFKQYGAVQDMYRSFDQDAVKASASLANLQKEKEKILNKLNSAGSLIEVEKLKAQLQGIQTSIDNVNSKLNFSAEKVLVQHAANQNDAARRTEASQQQRLQENRQEMQNLQSSFQQLFSAWKQ